MPEITSECASLPADDLSRALSLARVDSPTAQHIGLVGNTCTITVAGKGTDEPAKCANLYGAACIHFGVL